MTCYLRKLDVLQQIFDMFHVSSEPWTQPLIRKFPKTPSPPPADYVTFGEMSVGLGIIPRFRRKIEINMIQYTLIMFVHRVVQSQTVVRELRIR